MSSPWSRNADFFSNRRRNRQQRLINRGWSPLNNFGFSSGMFGGGFGRRQNLPANANLLRVGDNGVTSVGLPGRGSGFSWLSGQGPPPGMSIFDMLNGGRFDPGSNFVNPTINPFDLASIPVSESMHDHRSNTPHIHHETGVSHTHPHIGLHTHAPDGSIILEGHNHNHDSNSIQPITITGGSNVVKPILIGDGHDGHNHGNGIVKPLVIPGHDYHAGHNHGTGIIKPPVVPGHDDHAGHNHGTGIVITPVIPGIINPPVIPGHDDHAGHNHGTGIIKPPVIPGHDDHAGHNHGTGIIKPPVIPGHDDHAGHNHGTGIIKPPVVPGHDDHAGHNHGTGIVITPVIPGIINPPVFPGHDDHAGHNHGTGIIKPPVIPGHDDHAGHNHGRDSNIAVIPGITGHTDHDHANHIGGHNDHIDGKLPSSYVSPLAGLDPSNIKMAIRALKKAIKENDMIAMQMEQDLKVFKETGNKFYGHRVEEAIVQNKLIRNQLKRELRDIKKVKKARKLIKKQKKVKIPVPPPPPPPPPPPKPKNNRGNNLAKGLLLGGLGALLLGK